jgi:DNA-binding helix-hairpin-helix protein with protein kinase domain
VQADRHLAAARDCRIVLQHRLEAAKEAERSARRAATIPKSSLEAALAAIKTRHETLQSQRATFIAKSANLEADLTRGWADILDQKRNAQSVYHRIRNIEATRQTARRKAHDDARQAQLSVYLDQFFINRESWPRIPKSTLAALSSYGIETAADINDRDVRAVPGFGDVRTGYLMDWRRRRETGFQFDPTKAVHSSQLQQEERRLTAERRQHERDLVRAKAQIDAVQSGLQHRIADHERNALEVVKQMAQVLVDSQTLQLGLPALSLAPPIQARTAPPPSPPQVPPPWSPTKFTYGRAWASRKRQKKHSKNKWGRRP